jgi:hypothetical protein
MQATEHSKIDFGLPGVRIAAEPTGEQQRPLGKAYRLILSYEPKQTAAQSTSDEIVPRPADSQPTAG